MKTVWGVFLWRRDRGASYDLQAIGSTEDSARELADLTRHAPWIWVELSTRRHWVAIVDGVHFIVRVSAIELDRKRDDRDSDPAGLRDEMTAAWARLEAVPERPIHGDTAASVGAPEGQR